MSEKKRDKKNRILRDRESQMKDGRYCYTYYENGKQKRFYSWKLEKGDKVPQGKRDCISLREQIKAMNLAQNAPETSQKPHFDTVLTLVEKYIATRKDVKQTTFRGYKTLVSFLKKDEFGSRCINEVKKSDAKLWLIHLQEECGKGYSTLHTFRGILRPAFQMAVDDDILNKNPFDFYLGDVVLNDMVKREALTLDQERRFLEFLKNDNYYSKMYHPIFILLNTGLRIGEFCGLTIHDIDMEEKNILVSHQLQKIGKDFIISEPKTKTGIRTIPMTKDVYKSFEEILQNRKESENDKYKDFLFCDKNGNPLTPLHWEKYFNRIVAKYNSIYKIELPNITPHICRHTYCTKLVKRGLSVKSVQYSMGHSDVCVTLNVYTHFNFDETKDELKKLNMI